MGAGNPAGESEDVNDIEHIALDDIDGILNDSSDTYPGGEVVDLVIVHWIKIVESLGEWSVDEVEVGMSGGEILASSGGEIIDDRDMSSLFEEEIREMRSDEARTTGDERVVGLGADICPG